MVFLLPWSVRTWEWVGRSCMTKICSWIVVLELLCFRPLLNNQAFISGGLQSTADNFVEKCLELIIPFFPPCISSESFIISAFKMILFHWAKNAFLNRGLTSKPVVSVLLSSSHFNLLCWSFFNFGWGFLLVWDVEFVWGGRKCCGFFLFFFFVCFILSREWEWLSWLGLMTFPFQSTFLSSGEQMK